MVEKFFQCVALLEILYDSGVTKKKAQMPTNALVV
jgi:hypothetical protein